MSYYPLKNFAERAEEVRPSVGEAAQPLYDRVIASVDPDKVIVLQQKYREQLLDFDPIGIYKYADLPFWIGRATAIVQRLGLEDVPPLSILDIGMGAGHLAAVLQALGHRVVGTDIAVPLYDDIAEALGIDRRIVPVERGAPYPDVGGAFDRIIIIWQVFDYIREHEDGTRDYWSLEDWETFLRDLATNHAAPGGVIHLELNPQMQKGQPIFDQALLDFCASKGATVDRNTGIITLPVDEIRYGPQGAAPWLGEPAPEEPTPEPEQPRRRRGLFSKVARF